MLIIPRINSSWKSFLVKKRCESLTFLIFSQEAIASEFFHSKFGWWYGENICIENNTSTAHIYTTNKTHYEHLLNITSRLLLPKDKDNYRAVLKFQIHLDTIPSHYKTLDNFYLFINRGWNNMYHHSEWIIQFIRYIIFSTEFPEVHIHIVWSVDENGCSFPGY